MGAKTSLLAIATIDPRAALAAAATVPSSAADAEALVRQVFPDHDVTPLGTTGTLWDDVFPPDDLCYAAVLPGISLVCDTRLAVDRPSELPAHLVDLTDSRRMVLHAMHSVVDWFCLGVWEDGVLKRGLSVLPDDGVIEDVGDPLPFEQPFLAGEHPVEPWDDEEPDYPLPFHPLELGEAALRALFGFALEGVQEEDDVDAEAVVLHAFRVVDRTGAEQAARERLLTDLPPAQMQLSRLGADGRLHRIDWSELEDHVVPRRPGGRGLLGLVSRLVRRRGGGRADR